MIISEIQQIEKRKKLIILISNLGHIIQRTPIQQPPHTTIQA